MEVLMRDLYCFQCSLQFDNKYVFDFHLSAVHGKIRDIKQEPGFQTLIIPETNDFEIRDQYVENCQKNEPKISEVLVKTPSGQNRDKNVKCDICDTSFGQKGDFNRHVLTVHEGKKQFKCDICDANFGQKNQLNQHVASVHGGNKQFQ